MAMIPDLTTKQNVRKEAIEFAISLAMAGGAGSFLTTDLLTSADLITDYILNGKQD